jgi:hypothetical protein
MAQISGKCHFLLNVPLAALYLNTFISIKQLYIDFIHKTLLYIKTFHIKMIFLYIKHLYIQERMQVKFKFLLFIRFFY